MFGYGWCNGMGVGGWLLMIGFWGAFLGLVVWAIVRLFPGRVERPGSDALELLDRRFAGGEIDAESYREKRDALTGGSGRQAETAWER